VAAAPLTKHGATLAVALNTSEIGFFSARWGERPRLSLVVGATRNVVYAKEFVVLDSTLVTVALGHDKDAQVSGAFACRSGGRRRAPDCRIGGVEGEASPACVGPRRGNAAGPGINRSWGVGTAWAGDEGEFCLAFNLELQGDVRRCCDASL
jgi:hypothetical protein